VAAGTAIITATSVQDVNRSGTATLTVTAAAANNVSVTVNRAAVLGENGAKTVMSGNIVVTNSGSADTAFSCTSSNANLVTMNNPTTCTYTPAATGSGDATITVAAHADNSKTATFTVHVGNWVLVGSGGVGLVDINKGTAMTQLLPGSAHCSYPSISYDATMFVCQHIGAVGEDDLLQIYQTDGTASGTTLLTAVDLMAQAGIATQSNPSLSPDGTKIVFSSPTTGGAQAVYVINTDWTGLTSLFTEAVSGVAISPVHFTPDGKKIMFENVSTMTVWIMNADGSSPQPLVSAPSNTALYSVDADGGMSTLYYSDGSNTYVEDAATGNIKTTINGSYLMGVLPNEGGILLLDGGGLSVLPADGVGAPIVLAIGSGWGSAY
jgi:Tol biopolymer transport system component